MVETKDNSLKQMIRERDGCLKINTTIPILGENR